MIRSKDITRFKMNSRLLRKYIRESLGREVMFSPERLAGDKFSAASQQKSVTKMKTIDKTNLSVDEMLEELIIAAGPNTYIRFERKRDEAEFPNFDVSDQVNYATPFGIYGYPLDQVNLENLVNHGMPTKANFATIFEFFHVYKLDTSKMAKVRKKSNDKLEIYGRYSTKKKVIDDIAECVRVALNLLTLNNPPKEIPRSPKSPEMRQLEKDIQSLSQTVTKPSIVDLHYIFKNYSHVFIIDENNPESSINVIEDYKQEIAGAVFNFILEYSKKRGIEAGYGSKPTKQYMLFNILKRSIESIASGLAKAVSNNNRGQYYSILLKAIGITGIDDIETSTIHSNEPSQSVSFDFSGDTIEPIGTFKNIFKDLNFKKEQPIQKKFNQILEDLISSGIVNWNTDNESRVMRVEKYNYGDLSLESFKKIYNSKNSVKSAKDVLSDKDYFAIQVINKTSNPDILEHIYKLANNLNFQMQHFYFGPLLINDKSSSYIADDLYKKLIKQRIGMTNQEMYRSCDPAEFGIMQNVIASPLLSKESKLDIVDKTEKPEGFNSFHFPMSSLVYSKYLEKETAHAIIDKFGFEESSIFNNDNAPITDILLKDVIDGFNLTSKKLDDLDDDQKNEAIARLSKILYNSNASDIEIKQILSMLSPVLKEMSAFKINKDDPEPFFNAPEYYNEVYWNLLRKNSNLSSELLKAANLTLEEEVNLLKVLAYCMFLSDEEIQYSGLYDIEKEFDIVEFLDCDIEHEHVDQVEVAKNVFSRAYEYFVNAKKHGVG